MSWLSLLRWVVPSFVWVWSDLPKRFLRRQATEALDQYSDGHMLSSLWKEGLLKKREPLKSIGEWIGFPNEVCLVSSWKSDSRTQLPTGEGANDGMPVSDADEEGLDLRRQLMGDDRCTSKVRVIYTQSYFSGNDKSWRRDFHNLSCVTFPIIVVFLGWNKSIAWM